MIYIVKSRPLLSVMSKSTSYGDLERFLKSSDPSETPDLVEELKALLDDFDPNAESIKLLADTCRNRQYYMNT